jgi:hypothetical protein
MIPNDVHIVEVSRGSKDVDPAKRTVAKIGRLDSSGVNALNEFLQRSRKKTFSFVLSDYYLDLVDESGGTQRRYGVVINDGGRLVGLDITTSDPAKTNVTSGHFVLVSSDETAASKLLQAIRSVDKEKP